MSHCATTTEDHCDNDSCNENKVLTPVDPEADSTKWMNDGPPDLSGFEHHCFALVAKFNISCYVNILADSVSDGTTAMSDFTRSTQLLSIAKSYGKDKDSEASDFACADNEWGQWS